MGWGQVANYSFTSSSGTYTAITGGTAHNTTSTDNANYSFNLPFTFTYNGTGYTVTRPTTNGFLVLGANAASTTNYTPLSNSSTSSNFAISAFGADLSSIVRSEVLGSSPNRVYVCQWSAAGRYSSGLQADNMNFQIRLYETSNKIEIIYGSNSATSASSTVQVGLRGSANTDFNNRTSTTNWASTTSGSSNTSSITSSGSVSPPAGLTFTWSIPTCYIPTSLTSSSISTTGATIAWTAPSTGTTPASYEYEVRTAGAAGSGSTGLVTSGTTTAPTVTTNITGLTAATTYSYYVRSNCGSGDYSSWASGSFTTACDVPYNPGAISVSGTSSSGFTLTYSAASPAPTSYILFNTTGTSAAATTIPTLTNGTTYSSSTAYTIGGTSYNCISTSSVSPIALSGGVSNTQYNYFLFSRNATNSCSGNPYFSSGVTVSAVTCPAAPTTPVNSSITTNSATISWTASAVGGGYATINYSLEVYTDSGYTTAISGSPFAMGTALTQNLTGLTGTTTYYYRIVANNGVCNSSYLTGSINTLCAVENAPTSVQTFSTFSGSAPNPICWSEATGALAATSNLTAANSAWLNKSGGFANANASNVAVSINLYSTKNEWFISNQIDLGNIPGIYRLKYDMAVTSYNGTTSQSTLSTHNVKVIISTDGGTTWSNANTLKTYTGSGTYSNTGQTEYIELTGYSGVVKIAFVATTSSSTPDIDFHIDNFRVEAIPTCFEPNTMVLSSITNNSASLSWTAPASAPGSGYDLYYSTTNTAPTFGTTPSASVASGTTYAFTGLTASTTYYSWVRSNCGSGDVSLWVASASFTTQCNPVTSFPWTEGFEGLTSVSTTTFPSCWLEGTGTNWNSLSAATSTYNDPRSGNYYIGCSYGGTNDRIWTPGFQLTAGVSYDFSTYFVGDGYSGWTGDIIYNTSASASGETVLGTSFITSSTTSTGVINYSQITRTFVPSTSGVYYFGIKITSTYTPYSYLAFDDFKLEVTPSCLPPNSLVLSSITTNSASLTWTAPVSAPGSGYDVYYSTTNTSPTAGTTPSANVASGTTYAFTGLSVSTTYYAWVRSNCGSGDVSTWATNSSFTTLQIPATLPYSDDFTSNNLIFVNGSQTNKWAYGAVVGNSGNSIYISNDNGVTHAYSLGSSSVVHAYRDISIPAGATLANFSFDWLGNAESCCDYTRVWLVPTTYFPSAGTQISSGTGRIQVAGNFNSQTTWQTYTNSILDVSSFANTTMRLVFEWRNDGSTGPNPPGAIDNISFKLPNTWTGATSSSWNTASNWSDNAVPSNTDNILISSNGSNAPILDTNVTVPVGKNLTISGTGTLSINATSTLTIAGTANFGGKAVTIKSDANGNGAIGQVTGTLSGATNVTVERYIPANRAWRALTAPLKGSNSSIFSQWQNNGTVATGVGIELWHPSGDASPSSSNTGLAIGPNSSILQYTSGAWVGVANTNTTNLFTTSGNNAFMVFPTGSFGSGNITTNTSAAATTLKATGQLISGPVTYSSLSNTNHTLIGNPYASPLDPAAVITSNASLGGNIWVWDANTSGTNNVGCYNLFNNNAYANVTGSLAAGVQIQSGQAFFVKPTANLASFSIQEAHKGTAFSNAVLRNGVPELFRVGLYKQVNNEWAGRDGAMTVILSDAAANQAPNKMANGSENIAFTKNGALFASNHHLPLVATNVLNVKVWNTTAGANYKLKINTEAFTATNLSATLEDLFTNSRTPLNLEGAAVEYPFTVTTDALSSGDRFRIVFQNAVLGTNNPTTNGFQIVPNPVTGDSFQVNLGTLATGTYSYSICNAIGQEVEKGSIQNATQNTNYTVKFKENAATGIYIMKIKGSDNSVFTAKIIKK